MWLQNAVNALKKLWVNAMTKSNAKSVKVTLIKSVYGQLKSHQATVRGLGLRRIRDSAVLVDTPEIRGMIRASGHLLKVEQA
jgi:large subunit ribosomal protein L30